MHENGQLVAVGNDKGNVYLVEFSGNLAVNNKNDKALLTAVNICNKKNQQIIKNLNNNKFFRCLKEKAEEKKY